MNPTRAEICLLTGGTGFIGGHLVERLVHQGSTVRCLVRRTSDTAWLESMGVELALGDITDPGSLARAASGCRYVFHCAALVSDWATTAEITEINVGGTRNVVEAAAACGAERFVHLSTTDVYGHPGGTGIGETYRPARVRNWYARTKLAAEAELWRVASTYAMDVVVLRPATIFGPRSDEVVGQIAQAIRRRQMLLIDRGEAVAGLCYVENLIDAVVLAQSHRDAPGQTFNVSDGLDVTWRQFTDDLAAGLGCPPVRLSMPYWLAKGIGFSLEQGYRLLRKSTGLKTQPLLSRQAVQVMGRSQRFSTRKLHELLGWTPRVDYLSGLRATLEWLHREATELQ